MKNAPTADRRGVSFWRYRSRRSRSLFERYGVSVISSEAEAVPPLKVPIQMS